MSPNAFQRVFSLTAKSVLKRFLLSLIRSLLIDFIALIFVEISTIWRKMITLGKDSNQSERQKRLRAKLIDSSDPSSPYRAVEVLD